MNDPLHRVIVFAVVLGVALGGRPAGASPASALRKSHKLLDGADHARDGSRGWRKTRGHGFEAPPPNRGRWQADTPHPYAPDGRATKWSESEPARTGPGLDAAERRRIDLTPEAQQRLIRQYDADLRQWARTASKGTKPDPELAAILEGRRSLLRAYANAQSPSGVAHFFETYVRPHKKKWLAAGALTAFLAGPDLFIDAAGGLTERAVAALTRLGIEVAAAPVRGVRRALSQVCEPADGDVPWLCTLRPAADYVLNHAATFALVIVLWLAGWFWSGRARWPALCVGWVWRALRSRKADTRPREATQKPDRDSPPDTSATSSGTRSGPSGRFARGTGALGILLVGGGVMWALLAPLPANPSPVPHLPHPPDDPAPLASAEAEHISVPEGASEESLQACRRSFSAEDTLACACRHFVPPAETSLRTTLVSAAAQALQTFDAEALGPAGQMVHEAYQQVRRRERLRWERMSDFDAGDAAARVTGIRRIAEWCEEMEGIPVPRLRASCAAFFEWRRRLADPTTRFQVIARSVSLPEEASVSGAVASCGKRFILPEEGAEPEGDEKIARWNATYSLPYHRGCESVALHFDIGDDEYRRNLGGPYAVMKLAQAVELYDEGDRIHTVVFECDDCDVRELMETAYQHTPEPSLRTICEM